ncbi:MAG: hypothetical protein IPM47_20985 [Sphingobacteriales bacterium]|nr:MAG: hypothetical protein IPM47_20985 [Sphingobacteriales bacterium]
MKTTFVCFLLMIAFSSFSSCQPSEQESDNNKVAGETKPTSDGVNNKAIEVNIKKGLDYLLQRGNDIEPNAAMVLHFLQRKFSLGKEYEFSNFFETYPIKDAKGKALERMVNPNAGATSAELGVMSKGTSLLDNLSNTSYAMNCALMCDKIPLSPGYFALLEQLTDLDRYFLTHAALSLQWLEENNCLTNREEAQKLRKKQHELIAKLIDKLGKPTDLQMESVAILMYIGGREYLQPEWINLISQKQLSNGGWPLGEMSQNNPHDHATVHALWALLEYLHPEAPPTTWIMK